ncbi:DUF885 family protein, partial [bacterium]
MKNERGELQKYLKDYWEKILKDNPTFATYIGDHRYNDALEDLSEKSITAQTEYFKELLVKVERTEDSSLSYEDKLNRQLLKTSLTNFISFYRFKTYYIPLNHMSGPHIDFPQIVEYHPFHTIKDVEHYLSRLNAFPLQTDQVIENLQRGIKQNITAFQKSMEHVIEQVETFTKFTPENNPLFSPL